MKKVFCFAILLFCFSLEVHTQDYWESVWSTDGTCFAFLTDTSGNIIAGTLSNILKSTDDGLTWNKKASGQRFIYFAKDKFGQFFCGTHSASIMKSTNNGENWSSFNSLGHPDARPILFLNNGDILADSYKLGLYRSTDNGATWSHQQVDSGNVFGVWSLLALPDGDILAGTDHYLYKSTDNGYSWMMLNFDSDCPDVMSLLLTKNGDIYAGSKSAKCGIFKSTDFGDTWEKAFLGIDLDYYEYVWEMTESPNGRIYISTLDGVYVTYDKGKTAYKVAPNISGVDYYWQIYISPGGHLFLGTDKGIYRSKEIVTDVGIQNHLQEVKLLPEIIDGSLQSEITVNVNDNFSLEITNITGKNIFSGKANDYIKIDTDKLDQGIYFYKIISGTECRTGKFLKL